MKKPEHQDEIISLIDDYLSRLFFLCRSITGNQNRQTLKILQEVIPLTIVEVPTGTKSYDWTVPQEWNIQDAYISNKFGKKIVEFSKNNLHVVSYSTPVNSTLSWAELKPHLHYHPVLADAIPYRTSYYQKNWGFCLTQNQYALLQKDGGPFRVVIDSTLHDGSLTFGELLLPGRSKQEILLSCYICHPSMANDSLSGVLLCAFLARSLMKTKDRYYSYRIVFVPETIGAIVYCAKNEKAMKSIDTGLVITTVGGPGKFGYKKSYESNHCINRLIEEVFFEKKTNFITYPFDIHGSDERQYSSLGFRINTGTITRDKYYEYAQYHSSLDDLAFVNASHIYEALTIYKELINKLDSRKIYKSTNFNCEVMLSKHGLYPTTGGAQNPTFNGRSELDIILWILFLSDGRKSVDDISLEIGVDSCVITALSEKLSLKGALQIV